jgi:hypothetical protein
MEQREKHFFGTPQSKYDKRPQLQLETYWHYTQKALV